MEGKGYTPGDGRPPAIWHAQNGWGLPGTPLSALDVTPMSSRENVVFPCLSDHRVWSAGGRWRGTSVRWAGGPAPLACPCSAPLIGSSPGSWSWPKVVTWWRKHKPRKKFGPWLSHRKPQAYWLGGSWALPSTSPSPVKQGVWQVSTKASIVNRPIWNSVSSCYSHQENKGTELSSRVLLWLFWALEP